PDLVRIAVVDTDDVEAARAEAAVLRKRRADLAGADDDDRPLLFETEDLANGGQQVLDRVAKPALAEGSEEGEVLPDLCRRGAARACELAGGDGRLAARVELLEEAEIEREATDRGFSDLLCG